MASAQAEPPKPPPAGVDVRDKFDDYDTPTVYERVKNHGLSEHSRNFVVNFGGSKAEVAMDLEASDFDALLQMNNKNTDTPVRWINIWNPSLQQEIVLKIGKKYGFSSRLILTIREWDTMKRWARGRGQDKAPRVEPVTKPPAGSGDVEKDACDSTEDDTSLPQQSLLDENAATFSLMQDSMNYTSFDLESKFICVGANWLYNRPRPQKKTDLAPEDLSLVPPSHRMWFARCCDNTVVSFHEEASYQDVPSGEDHDRWRSDELKNMRANTLKVLRQLSQCGLQEDKDKILQLTSIRAPLMGAHHGQTHIELGAHGIEGSSNLFYYLFEDYSGAVAILNSSKKVLSELGDRVLKTADWKHHQDTSDIIPNLYTLNKELRQLQHLFTSYRTLIDRILTFDNNNSLGNAMMSSTFLSSDQLDQQEQLSHPDHLGQLSKKARGRFERLRDQLQSLMLDTIQDYLDEKESLQSTYFNLLNQKDSQATARLTRSATLLAKLSVLFLPISFVTSYYSVQIQEINENASAKTYQTLLGAIGGGSLICLFFFSRALTYVSDRLDHWTDSTAKKMGAKFKETHGRWRSGPASSSR